MISFRSVIAATALAATLVMPAGLFAQGSTGTVGGVVRDSQGGAVPGATVHVVSEDTDTTADSVSDERGAYRTGALPPGRYRLETTLDGFEKAISRTVLAAGQAATVDV